MRKRILPFIMIMLMIFTALPISASASTLYYGKTINSGETYTDTSFEMWCWYGNETFTNNGTVNISNGFTLGYQASFVNNSEFTFTGSNSTFGVSSGCSFQITELQESVAVTTWAWKILLLTPAHYIYPILVILTFPV